MALTGTVFAVAMESLRMKVAANGHDNVERNLRVELAALYRVIAHLGWDELIYTHSSHRIPGTDTFLINPYGLRFDEITASNLVKVDVDGNAIGEVGGGANYAGFVIHSALHMSRDDAHCIIHTHTTAGMAVACQAEGLLPLSMYAHNFYQKIGYHDYEGPSMDTNERERIIKSAGNYRALIMKNHGLLTCGRTVSEAFVTMFRLQRACEVQLAAQSGGVRLEIPSHDVCADAARLTDDFLMHGGAELGKKEFDAMVRLVDRADTTYRN
jgi:ribulose-5-phosphate 4-epimerase/fuculose-1-phosphate aldolase